MRDLNEAIQAFDVIYGRKAGGEIDESTFIDLFVDCIPSDQEALFAFFRHVVSVVADKTQLSALNRALIGREKFIQKLPLSEGAFLAEERRKLLERFKDKGHVVTFINDATAAKFEVELVCVGRTLRMFPGISCTAKELPKAIRCTKQPVCVTRQNKGYFVFIVP